VVAIDGQALYVEDNRGEGRNLQQVAQVLLGSAQSLLHPTSFATLACLTHLALDYRDQTRQTAFENAGMRARLQRGHSRILGEFARHRHKPAVRSRIPADLLNLGQAESRHGGVTQNDIPGLLLERLSHALGCVDTLVLHGQSRLSQVPHQQSGITGRAFDDQDAKQLRQAHTPPCSAA